MGEKVKRGAWSGKLLDRADYNRRGQGCLMGIEPLARMLMFAMCIVMHMRSCMAYIILRVNALTMEKRGVGRTLYSSL